MRELCGNILFFSTLLSFSSRQIYVKPPAVRKRDRHCWLTADERRQDRVYRPAGFFSPENALSHRSPLTRYATITCEERQGFARIPYSRGNIAPVLARNSGPRRGSERDRGYSACLAKSNSSTDSCRSNFFCSGSRLNHDLPY